MCEDLYLKCGNIMQTQIDGSTSCRDLYTVEMPYKHQTVV